VKKTKVAIFFGVLKIDMASKKIHSSKRFSCQNNDREQESGCVYVKVGPISQFSTRSIAAIGVFREKYSGRKKNHFEASRSASRGLNINKRELFEAIQSSKTSRAR
jgi:hypothetical protein